MTFALIGNQNCGKTTLFNALTGSNQHVGNFPGVTVDSKSGDIRGVKDCQVVDLPGIYSIRPYTNEETVTLKFLLDGKPDGIINIVDATNIERNLYLTLQLIELHIPTVLALNMMDEVRSNGGVIDVTELSEHLGIPVLPISAAKNEGVDELIHTAIEVAQKKILPKYYDFCRSGPVHRCVHALYHMLEDHAEAVGMPARFAAVKVIEEDPEIIGRLGLNQNEIETFEHSIIEMENEFGLDRYAAIAETRYEFIEGVCKTAVKKPHESREHKRSVKMDKVLTNKFLAIPLFLGIMLLVFWLSFDLIGGNLSELVETGTTALSTLVDKGLTEYGINPVVKSLVVDGIFAGVGSVLSFLPIIIVLFFFLSILEDSGYMARIAFVMDKPLRKIGLSGKSIVPMLIGFGCTVPAVMSTRTMSSERDRKMTILLLPFMSCSAKIAIYAVFARAFFPGYSALCMMILYLLGIVTGIIMALVMKVSVFKGKPVPFIMELPNYRMPGAKNVMLLLWDKAKDFIQKAFTVIFLASMAIWFLQSFDTRFNIVADPSDSMLAGIGKLIAPIFRPTGFEDWRAVTALITGLSAKETVVSTLGILCGETGTGIYSALGSIFSVQASAAFLVFTLLYTPCVAAIGAIRRELGSRIKTVGVVLFQCGVAYLAAVLVYQVAMLIS